MRHFGGPGGARFTRCVNNCLVIVDFTDAYLVPFHVVVPVLQRGRPPDLGKTARLWAKPRYLFGPSSIGVHVRCVVSASLALYTWMRASWYCSTAFSAAAFIFQVRSLLHVSVRIQQWADSTTDTFIHISAKEHDCQSRCTDFFGKVLSVNPLIIAVLIKILAVHLTNGFIYWDFNRISCGIKKLKYASGATKSNNPF